VARGGEGKATFNRVNICTNKNETLMKQIHNSQKSIGKSIPKGMGEQVSPLPQEVEAAIIGTLRDELEVNFGVEVTRNFDLRRTVEDAEAEDYAVIGGSHGGSLVKALEMTGRQVTDLTEKGLRMTAEAVTKLEKTAVSHT
jgi:hypothetical protein